MKRQRCPFRERLKARGSYVRLADYVDMHGVISPLPLEVQKRLRVEMIVGRKQPWWEGPFGRPYKDILKGARK